jgi:hypothetical protein
VAHADSKPDTVRPLDRVNLRLEAETFAAIDDACAVRPGNVSRNTWIAEAVQEKLARTPMVAASSAGRRRARG